MSIRELRGAFTALGAAINIFVAQFAVLPYFFVNKIRDWQSGGRRCNIKLRRSGYWKRRSYVTTAAITIGRTWGELLMSWRKCWLAVLVLAVAQNVAWAQEQEEPVPRKRFQTKPEEKPAEVKLVPAGSITGRISRISEDGRSLTLTVTIRVQEPNPHANPRDPRTYFRWVDRQQDIEYELEENVKVRLPPPSPYQVDEKGKTVVKPFKPDPKSDPDFRLGGVKGDVKDLTSGMMVTLELKRAVIPGKPINQAPIRVTLIKVLANPTGQ